MQLVGQQFVGAAASAREEVVEQQDRGLSSRHWYHDDAQLGQAAVEGEGQVAQDAVVVVAPGECQEQPRGGSPELACCLLPTDPTEGLGLLLGEAVLHLRQGWRTYRYLVWPEKMRPRNPIIIVANIL